MLTPERREEINTLITSTRQHIENYPSPDDLLSTAVWMELTPSYLASISFALGELQLEVANKHMEFLINPTGVIPKERWDEIKKSSTLVETVYKGVSAKENRAIVILSGLQKNIYEAYDNSRAISYCNRKEKAHQ